MVVKKDVPSGILVFVVFIFVLDILFFIYLGYSIIYTEGDFSEFLSFSTFSIMMWLDFIFAILSLLIIPYGFMKRKNWARFFAILFLLISISRVLQYILMTGKKTIGFLLFVLFVVSIMYLLMTPVKKYFGIISMDIVPSETRTEYTYGLYTLYSERVRLKNGKNQVIYFFSKKKPKSGTPASFPDGFEVEESMRSGLPFLKKRQVNYVSE
jgi:hypothetical protein